MGCSLHFCDCLSGPVTSGGAASTLIAFPCRLLAKGAEDRSFWFVISLDLFFSGPFGASQFRPKKLVGASNNAGSPEGGGPPPQPGSVVKPSVVKKIFLLGNSLLGSLVFTRYWELVKKKGFFFTRFQNLVIKKFFFTWLLGSHLAHLWATSHSAPRSEAVGNPWFSASHAALRRCVGTAAAAAGVCR